MLHKLVIFSLCAVRVCLASLVSAPKNLLDPVTQIKPVQALILSYLHVWEQVAQLTGHADETNELAWSKDGNYLASGSKEMQLLVWHYLPKESDQKFQLHRIISGNCGSTQIKTPNGEIVYWTGHDDTNRWLLFDSAARNYSVYRNGFLAGFMTHSPDTRYILSNYAREGCVVISDRIDINDKNYEFKQILADKFSGLNGIVLAGAWSPDSTSCALAFREGTIEIWKREDSNFKKTEMLLGHKTCINAVAFSPDGNYLVSGSLDHSVGIWKITAGMFKFHTRLDKQKSYNSTLAWSPNSSFLATTAQGNAITIWRIAAGSFKLHQKLPQHKEVYSISWSPDGKYLALGGSSGVEILSNQAVEIEHSIV